MKWTFFMSIIEHFLKTFSEKSVFSLKTERDFLTGSTHQNFSAAHDVLSLSSNSKVFNSVLIPNQNFTPNQSRIGIKLRFLNRAQRPADVEDLLRVGRHRGPAGWPSQQPGLPDRPAQVPVQGPGLRREPQAPVQAGFRPVLQAAGPPSARVS